MMKDTPEIAALRAEWRAAFEARCKAQEVESAALGKLRAAGEAERTAAAAASGFIAGVTIVTVDPNWRREAPYEALFIGANRYDDAIVRPLKKDGTAGLRTKTVSFGRMTKVRDLASDARAATERLAAEG